MVISMSDLAIHRETVNAIAAPLPAPRSAISIRVAVPTDLKFIDDLQRQHSHQVGWMAKSWFEKNIADGNIIIAEDAETSHRVGYCLYKNRYQKREDVGICYQLNVVPAKHRGLIGASLIKAAFERCPYGVKLFCCWCAQDIEANHFWESIGFVPLAFRTGSRSRAHGGHRKDDRIQIFWQRRIREGDETTPYWYPTETQGGALKENRIALPIPPGTHWSDAKPAVLPGMEKLNALPEGEAEKLKRERKPKVKAPPVNPISASGGLWFAPPAAPAGTVEAKPKPKREKQKNDPQLVAAAREFRDRYLDEVNSGRHMLESNGKYDVSRQLAAAPATVIEQVPLLNAA
jgi:hypothetical protein